MTFRKAQMNEVNKADRKKEKKNKEIQKKKG